MGRAIGSSGGRRVPRAESDRSSTSSSWRWVTLASVLIAGFTGCSGQRGNAAGESDPAAGESSSAGSAGAWAGEAGSSAQSSDAGRGGTRVMAQGGGSGDAAVGAAGGGGSGTDALGGSAGSVSGNGGAASGAGGGTLTLPDAWRCRALAYQDGESCDCGCGAPDPDCRDGGVASCDVCEQLGGCAFGPCPSNVVPIENFRCEVPEPWTCGDRSYGDGFCDCGCGVLDSDCEGPSADLCLACPFGGCSRDFCATIDRHDNTVCTSAPYSWTCEEDHYRDGSICDCGCGFFDPDCKNRELETCERCDAEGSCSGQACPGLIEPGAVDRCFQPLAPPEWTCYPEEYGDGRVCNCGCGVRDPDCRENEAARCDSCACGPCPASVDPNDPTQCAPAPPEWTCLPEWYQDGTCDCGCGAVDVRCAELGYFCERCLGCANGHCDRIDPENTGQCTYQVPASWSCSVELYFDDVCDCGCGALDADCSSAIKFECDVCDAEGSCSNLACADPGSTILADDNTSCSG